MEALVNSPYVNPGTHRTPGARKGTAVLGYEISPYR